MAFSGAVEPETKVYIAFLTRYKAMPMLKICRRFKILRATVYGYRQLNLIACKRMEGKCLKVGGCPKKLSQRDERKLLPALHFLRKNEGHFSSLQIMDQAGISPKEVNVRTVRRCLNGHGYHFLQARRKGLLKENDCKLRFRFAKMMRKNFSKEVWKKDIAFYLDGVNFIHKINPADQARAPDARIWRMRRDKPWLYG